MPNLNSQNNPEQYDYQTNNDANNYFDDIVYEDNALLTPKEKVQDFLSVINTRAVLVIIGFLLFIVLIAAFIFFVISKINASYKTTISIPNIIYMRESNKIKVEGKGRAKSDKLTTSFEVQNGDIAHIVDKSVTGSTTETTIIPLKEGKTTIIAKSKLKNRITANVKEEVVICPTFDEKLLDNSNITIQNNNKHELNIDFGEEECGKDVTYESNNQNIFTVDEKGVITANNIGEAELEIKKGSKSISLKVKVQEGYVSMTSLTPSFSKLNLEQGDIVRLNFGVKPDNATRNEIIYSDYDREIISISNGGKITALKPGTTEIIAYTNYSVRTKISVYVGADNSPNSTLVANLESQESVNLYKGESAKVLVNYVPDNVSNKELKWTSEDPNIAFVTSNGVILGKNKGTTDVMIATNNNVTKAIKVTVNDIEEPKITTSDGIATAKWHKSIYDINFSSKVNGAVYYYGEDPEKVETLANSITVSSDEEKTYYIKACKNDYCSNAISYISQFDITKPKVLAVINNKDTNNYKIALEDNGSKIEKWCITKTENPATCKWEKIDIKPNPVIDYIINENGSYFIYSSDVAGNISDSYKVEV